MKYQVLGHKRIIKVNDKPYDVVCEFENLVQLYYMMNKVNPNIYDEILVIDIDTNELVASRNLEKPLVRKLKK